MSAFEDFRRATDARHGVGDVDLAASHGVHPHEFYRDTRKRGWAAPLPRVRIAPGAPACVQRDLLVVCAATRHLAAASGLTAAWLHGARQLPPRPATFLVAYGTAIPELAGTRGRRARWLVPDDVGEVRGVPTLVGPAVAISAARLPAAQLRALLIDLAFNRICGAEEVLDRLTSIGPIEGRGTLIAECRRLAGRHVESIFQDDVVEELTQLGYGPEPSTLPVATADGRGLTGDVALKAWKVMLEPSGDGFHHTREQRRIDRRRAASYAGTDWAYVPIDWRDWRDHRDDVLDGVDAAIAQQRRLGFGRDVEPPRRRGGPHDAQRGRDR